MRAESCNVLKNRRVAGNAKLEQIGLVQQD